MMPKKRAPKNNIAGEGNRETDDKRGKPCCTRVSAESIENQLHMVGVFTTPVADGLKSTCCKAGLQE